MLFFQSKSILDVCQILFYSVDFQSKAVGVLVFLFSVLLPVGKMIAALFAVNSPKVFGRSLLMKFMLNSSKWSMADVFVIAIFMSYIGFRGTISSQLARLGSSVERVNLLTTNETSLQLGFFTFTAFTLIGVYFSGKVKR